jgi:hypothetical protein
MKTCNQPLCLDHPKVTGIRELITKTYIKWLNRIPHCHHGYPHARHTSSVPKSEIFNPTITKPQRERLNSSQEDRDGRNTIWSNYINKARGTSRSCQIKNTRERERDQTHNYWYIPSAPRVNYSLLVMETAGMMKMASGDDFPLRQGAGKGLQMGSLGHRGLRRCSLESSVISRGFGIYKNFWHWNHANMG